MPDTFHLLDPDEILLLFSDLSEAVLAGNLEINPPIEDPTEHDEILGRVNSPFTRKLYAYTQFYARKNDQQKLAAKYAKDTKSRNEAEESVERLDQQRDAIKELMWMAIRAELNLWDGVSIAIRSEWRIVKQAHREGPEIILRKLFDVGGGGE